MFWTGFIIGVFVGANIGVVVAGLLISLKKNDAQDRLSETLMDQVVMDEGQEVHGDLPALPKPITYLDSYPHS